MRWVLSNILDGAASLDLFLRLVRFNYDWFRLLSVFVHSSRVFMGKCFFVIWSTELEDCHENCKIWTKLEADLNGLFIATHRSDVTFHKWTETESFHRLFCRLSLFKVQHFKFRPLFLQFWLDDWRHLLLKSTFFYSDLPWKIVVQIWLMTRLPDLKYPCQLGFKL